MSEISIKTTFKLYEYVRDEPTNFQALKELKQTEINHEILKNRIQVLRIHDERNIKKLENQQNKMNKIQQIRDENAKEKQKTKSMKKEIQKEICRKKIYNKEAKKNQEDRIQIVKDKIVHKKAQDYQKCQQIKNQNELNISREKEDKLEKNKRARNHVISMEKQTKGNILEFISKKNHTIHEDIKAEREILLQKKLKKEKELMKSSMVEMELVKKSSESEMAYKETKNKLDTMLGNLRKQNKVNKEKMKSFMKSSNTDASRYANIS